MELYLTVLFLSYLFSNSMQYTACPEERFGVTHELLDVSVQGGRHVHGYVYSGIPVTGQRESNMRRQRTME
jgi:hypothetical protein